MGNLEAKAVGSVQGVGNKKLWQLGMKNAVFWGALLARYCYINNALEVERARHHKGNVGAELGNG